MVQIYHVRPRDYLEMSLGVSSDLFIIQLYTNLFRCVFQKGKSVAMRFLFVSVAEKKNSKGHLYPFEPHTFVPEIPEGQPHTFVPEIVIPTYISFVLVRTYQNFLRKF